MWLAPCVEQEAVYHTIDVVQTGLGSADELSVNYDPPPRFPLVDRAAITGFDLVAAVAELVATGRWGLKRKGR